jgi:RNA polymerase sigma-70 factor (ECF subfamily)
MDVRNVEYLRRYLFSIAYRMLGSASDAEDVVQEAYLRYHSAPEAEVRSPKAYLSTVVTRLCLDQLKSARVTRETYHGPWLPEPVPTADLEPTPQERVERGEDVSLAFLLLLERLTPEERAAYVLREAFDYSYDEIASIIGKAVPTTRQLAHRAREHVNGAAPRFEVDRDEQRRLTERFLVAARTGDMQSLTSLLAADVVLVADGGVEARTARRPIRGRDNVLRLVEGGSRKFYADADVTLEDVNGGAAIVFWRDGVPVLVTTADVAGGQIQSFHSIVNPSKLAYLARRLSPSLTAAEAIPPDSVAPAG